MKLYKHSAKEAVSFDVNDTALSLDNPFRVRKNLKTIDNKIDQGKAKCSLDR